MSALPLALLAALAPARVDAAGDALPPGAVARMGSGRLHHGENVVAVALSGDGKLAASVASWESVRLWDADTGAEVPFRPGAGRVRCVARAGMKLAAVIDRGEQFELLMLPDGPSRVLPGVAPDGLGCWLTSDGGTLLWTSRLPGERFGRPEYVVRRTDVETGEGAAFAHQEGNDLAAVRFSADGRSAALRFQGGAVEVWNLARRERRFALKEPMKRDESFALSADGEVLATVDAHAQRVWLWNVADGTARSDLPGLPSERSASVAFSPDGRTFVVRASYENEPRARFWDYRTSTRLGDAPPCQKPALAGAEIAFSADGSRMAGAAFNGLALWDVVARRPLHDWRCHTGAPFALSWSPDGSKLVSGAGSADPFARVWDARTGRLVRQLAGHRVGVGGVDWSADGRWIATGSQDGSARLWDAATGEQRHRFPVPGWAAGVAFSPDSRQFAAVGNTQVHLIDVAAGKPVAAARVAAGRSVTFLDDRRVWVVTADGARLVDVPAGSVRPVEGDGPAMLKPLPSDRRFGLSWRADSALCRHSIAGGSGGVLVPGPNRGTPPEPTDADQPPDGRTVAVAYRNGLVVVYESATGGERFRLLGHAGDVLRVAYSPDGTRMASSGDEGTLVVWDVSGDHLPADFPDFAAAWDALLRPDAAAGFAAVRWLAARPAEAVPFLASRLRPESTRGTAGQLLARLAAPRYADREAASRALAESGELAALEAAANGVLTPEQRLRLREVLGQVAAGRLSGEPLRSRRAVEVLERAGTPEARRLLAELAGGAPSTRQTRDAAEALARLTGRGK